MNKHSSSDLIRLATRTQAIEFAPLVSEPLQTPLGERYVWHNKSSYLRASQYKRILPLLQKIISGSDLQFDYLVGSHTGGIPWASLLAEALNVPVVIEESGKWYTFSTYYSLDLLLPEKCDYIASNVFGIPLAVHCAYALHKPLLYIKPGASKHQKLILEGVPEENKSVCLYEAYTDSMKLRTAQHVTVLENANLKVLHGSGVPRIQPVSLRGKKVLLIDDLFTSGNGSLALLPSIRKAGGYVTDVLCLLNQQTESGKVKSKEDGVHIHSVMNTMQIVTVAASEGLLPADMISEYISIISKECFQVLS